MQRNRFYSMLTERYDLFRTTVVLHQYDETLTFNWLLLYVVNRFLKLKVIDELSAYNFYHSELGSLCEEIHGLMRVMWSGKWAVVTPHTVLTAIWHHIPTFRGYCQQDAQEFLWCVCVFVCVFACVCWCT